MANKWGKRLLGLVAVGAAVGGVVAYLNKKAVAATVKMNSQMILKMKILI